jgi:glycosyltransferase involved in cell wall biosynthesis
MSQAAARWLCRRLESQGLPEIAAKVRVFRGGVAATSGERSAPRRSADPIRLLFVGADGLRKGLVPVLDAVEALRQGGLDVRLTVVSSLLDRTYVFGELSPPLESLRRRLEGSPWVTYRTSLPNPAVRRLMREHDLFVLPTFDDSLGWAIAEAQTEGLPVVSTRVFAIPELVHDGRTGRLIDLEVNEDGRWAGLFVEGAKKASAIEQANDTIRRGVMDAVSALSTDPATLTAWSAEASVRGRRLYSPEEAGVQLRQIYDDALEGRVPRAYRPINLNLPAEPQPLQPVAAGANVRP